MFHNQLNISKALQYKVNSIQFVSSTVNDWKDVNLINIRLFNDKSHFIILNLTIILQSINFKFNIILF
jgi:hypothetical protein